MLDFIKGIVSTIGLVGMLLVGALVGFAIGIFAFWFAKHFITFFSSFFDNAPLIESTIHFLYEGKYSDIVQYVFIGAFTLFIPLSWLVNTKD
tara:strand:- start:2068 stop:2343 length:276 start_codon:yes stop_codon:yes gene_type:complete